MGQDVTLECQTEAHPKSINYWTTEKGDMIVSGTVKLISLTFQQPFLVLCILCDCD